jgi:ketosteroid isomerase-like protein
LFINGKILTFCMALSLPLGMAAAAPAPQSDKEAVLAVEKLVANATTPELGLSCFDPDVIQDDFFSPQRRGIKEVAKDFDVYMSHYTSFHADILDMTIDLQGDLAVAYSHQRFTAKGKSGGPDLNAVVRQTDVLRKKSGKWLITYQHLSLPIDIATFKPDFGTKSD